jgi:Spy/CpxP family protein refolding chaperone
MARAMGRWWDNPQMAEKLGVTADQKKKMDDNFQQYRLKLIDLHASLEKAETILEPLVAADQPDEAKIVAQIDVVAQARAELEKANARMLLGIRRVLTPEQWKKLQELRPGQGHGMAPCPGCGPGMGMRGPGAGMGGPMQRQRP